MSKLTSTVALLAALFGIGLSAAVAQNDEDMRKREKEFKKITRTLDVQGIAKGSMGEKLNEIFREYVSKGGCALVDAERLDSQKQLSFVPDEITSQDLVTDVKTRKAEVINANGTRMFWYIYRTADKDNTNLSITKTRFLEAFDSASNRIKVTPSKDFSNWVLSRNCTGYLNTKVDAKATFFTISASSAIQADFKNTASIVLIGGTFTSPISDILSTGGWRRMLLDLDTWRVYAENSDVTDDAWIMKSFDGILANKEVGISRNFSFNAAADATAPISIGSIGASLKTGMLDGSTINFNLYRLLISSDIDKKELRDQRFVKLSPASNIADAVKSATLTPDKAEKPLIKGITYEHSQLFRGMPKKLCESDWKLIDTKRDVFKSVSMKPVYQEIDSDDKTERIPVCAFRITGEPTDKFFDAAAGTEPSFEAVIRNQNASLKVGGRALEISVQQRFNPSTQPVPSYVAGSSAIPFSPQMIDSSKFSISWRDVDIKFDDSKESVKKDKGSVGEVTPVALSNCGQLGNFTILADLAAAEGSVYRMNLRSDLSLLTADYDSNAFSDEPCKYQTTISVPLARDGNPMVTRQLSLVLRVPKKKPPVPVPAPAPNPTPTQPTQSPTPQ